jgi:hypothetical protein
MAPSLPSDRQQELDSLRRICVVFADFFGPITLPSQPQALREIIDRAYEERALAGLRLARNDFIAMIQACTGQQRRDLDAMLRSQAGISLDELRAKQLERIEKIRRRGRIITEEQYYMVRERIEEVWYDAERSTEFRDLQSLLTDYEERVVARGRTEHDPRAS